jgi:predicted SprT family Zn-dependent metalloprotease
MKDKISLPKSLRLGSHTIEIIYKDEVRNDDGEMVLGMSSFLENKIYISQKHHKTKISDAVIAHTIYHEIVHFILYLMNQHELNTDEAFVDVLGEHMLQVSKSLA